jgi:dolichol kinase
MRLAVPSSFDPAPLLYPPVMPILVALLVAANVGGLVLPNIVLAISAIPKPLVPTAQPLDAINSLHWLLSCLPIFLSDTPTDAVKVNDPKTSCAIPGEAAILLYPLHQVLCKLLHYLTTTSLLPAELQLLSVALINLAIAALSPQAVILKAVLWGGGLSLAFLCGQVIRWGIALARVPKWRFNKPPAAAKRSSLMRRVLSLVAPRKVRKELLKGGSDNDESSVFSDSFSDADEIHSGSPGGLRRVLSDPIMQPDTRPSSPANGKQQVAGVAFHDHVQHHEASAPTKGPFRSKTHTPSGRRKRSASVSVQAFFYLTPEQALARKWLYAAYVYACIVGIILLLIRPYVGSNALQGEEPVGWALGYLLGDLPWFRLEVLKNNLDGWVCLPDLVADAASDPCLSGSVQHIRHALLGEAKTRLVLAAYWLSIVVMGLVVVFQLSPIYEVDTRRKVFHFMMVAMFLPAIFVDPAFAALALSLVLAVFLLLDLLRASQLPPLSKPIASFLAPFVDGRDHRGPVVISHIFLLIGCAIPLWLSLASLPRIGVGYAKGWELATRDISMVAGVVCVGLGDAAASLIGRRWGHHKWIWGGGKSLEGSVAFAVAVFAGLIAATIWLRLGGWPHTPSSSNDHVRNSTSVSHWESLISPMAWGTTVRDAGLCASMASLTEAVLTGGNDNVVVPVVLWTCVKALGL